MVSSLMLDTTVVLRTSTTGDVTGDGDGLFELADVEFRVDGGDEVGVESQRVARHAS